jgi:alpha,alpha-trehalase
VPAFRVTVSLIAARALLAARLGREFLKTGGFVTALIASGQQWDAPNGWPPLEWLAIE